MQVKSRQKSQIGAAARCLIAAALLAVGLAGTVLMAAAGSGERIVPVLTAADVSAWAPWNFSGERLVERTASGIRLAERVFG